MIEIQAANWLTLSSSSVADRRYFIGTDSSECCLLIDNDVMINTFKLPKKKLENDIYIM